MKICDKCGAQMPDEALCCTNCGTPLKASQMPDQSFSFQPGGDTGVNNKALAALVLGVSGIILILVAPFLANFPALIGLVLSVLAPELSGIPAIFGLLICIVGIVYGIKGRNRLPVGVPGRGIATAGLTLSIIGAIISGLMTLAVVCLVVGIFALCSTTPTANIDYYTAIYSIFFFI